MSETKIKICGLKRPEDIECVNALHPDYIGFVFFSKSSRLVSEQQAAELRSKLDPAITVVGVFLENEFEEIVSLAKKGIIDIVQVHGTKNRAMIEELRKEITNPIIEAFSIDTQEDVLAAGASKADYVLLDHGAGGGGQVFDWSLLDGIQREFFLAGGLNPENVENAVNRYKPFAVDVSSGVETDKVKDPDKIYDFITKVRAL